MAMQESEAKKRKEYSRCGGFAVLGSLLLLVGIAGLFFPFVPGALLMIVGAVTIVDPQSVRLQRIWRRSRTRFSSLERMLGRRWDSHGKSRKHPGADSSDTELLCRL